MPALKPLLKAPQTFAILMAWHQCRAKFRALFFFFFPSKRIHFSSKDRTTGPKLHILTCQATLKHQKKRQTGFDLL